MGVEVFSCWDLDSVWTQLIKLTSIHSAKKYLIDLILYL